MSRFLALAAALLGGVALSACRGTTGADCRCASDCRSGLVCSADGEKSLAGDLCYDAGVVGTCVEQAAVDTDAGSSGDLTEPSVYQDMPSSRDFQPPTSLSEPMTSSSDTGGETFASSSGTSTGSSSSTATSTGESTGTSTGGTGTTSTGEDTGTTADTGGTTSSTGTGGTTSGTTSGTTGTTG